MKTWVFFTTILISATIGYADEWNLVHWSKSEEELFKCLNNTKLPEVLNDIVEYEDLRSYVVERLAYLFHKQTEPKENIKAVAIHLINVIKHLSHLTHMQKVAMNYTSNAVEGDFIDLATELSVEAAVIPFNKDQLERIKNAIINALDECSDPEYLTFGNEYWGREPPRFVQEIPELAELLNMILANPVLSSFGGTESFYLDQSIIWKRSLTLIKTSLRRMNNAHELFEELWNMWNRRARLFYDGRNGLGYLDSFYRSNRPLVFSHPRCVIRRRHYNYSIRDQPVTNESESVFEMTRYRALNWNNLNTSCIFTVPSTAAMTESRHHFLWHRYQFFRMLFAYLESLERGLTGISGRKKWRAYSKEVTIVLKDSAVDYGAYLEKVQVRELSHEFTRNSPVFSSLVQSLQEGDQIDEFDLLMMYWHRLSCVGVDTTTTTKNWYQSFKHQLSKIFKAGPSKLRTTTAATASTETLSSINSSSTSGYDESKKGKGHVTRLPSGKFVPKNQRGSGNNDNTKNSSTGNERKYSHNPNDTTENCYGYITNSDDSEQTDLFMIISDSKLYMEEGLSSH